MIEIQVLNNTIYAQQKKSRNLVFNILDYIFVLLLHNFLEQRNHPLFLIFMFLAGSYPNRVLSLQGSSNLY